MKIVWYHGQNIGEAKKYSQIKKLFIDYCTNKYSNEILEAMKDSNGNYEITESELNTLVVAKESQFNLGIENGLYDIHEYDDCYVIDWSR